VDRSCQFPSHLIGRDEVLTDPYEPGGFGGAVGYKGIEEWVDLVTVSHDHADHNYVKGLKATPS